jgi:hypothetical protein
MKKLRDKDIAARVSQAAAALFYELKREGRGIKWATRGTKWTKIAPWRLEEITRGGEMRDAWQELIVKRLLEVNWEDGFMLYRVPEIEEDK